MTNPTWTPIWNFLSSAGAGGVIALLALSFLRRHLSSYLDEKGKNLATKEDIAAITREVEGVRHSFNLLLEEAKSRQQLRLAAVDKRLQVHQEAFTHWRALYMSASQEFHAELQKYRDWWNDNCLYLEPQVRQAYLDEASLQSRRRGQSMLPRMPSDEDFAFPNLLFKAIQLPTLSVGEQSELAAGARPK